MKTIIKTYNVYSFNELSEKSKEFAINDYINNWCLKVLQYEEMSNNMKKAIDKANAMQTPWFAGSYIYEYCLAEIKDFLNNFEVYFLEDGNVLYD